jgi:hypothetical protein
MYSLQSWVPPYCQVRFSPNIIRATQTECRKVPGVRIGMVLARRMAQSAPLSVILTRHGTTSVTMLPMSAFILIGMADRFFRFHILGMATCTTSIQDIGAVDSGDMSITAVA